MKHTTIPYCKELDDIKIECAGDILEEFGKQETIDSLNWVKEYAYRPITLFNIARSKDALYIKYYVRGNMLRAIYSNDQEPVNEDSCVEFFCKTIEDDYYRNFEFNCIGTCSSATRRSKNEDVRRFTTDELKTILRSPSIGRRAFNEMEGIFEWDLTVKIPFNLMGIDANNLPVKILGNFNKCADGTDSKHYLSWNPIKSEKPDFHRPEFFGELYFE